MTLKEKINDSIITNIDIRESENRMYYEYNNLELAERCEVIADEFAIGFVKFVNETDSYHHAEDAFHFNDKWHTYEEFLEIYKKNL